MAHAALTWPPRRPWRYSPAVRPSRSSPSPSSSARAGSNTTSARGYSASRPTRSSDGPAWSMSPSGRHCSGLTVGRQSSPAPRWRLATTHSTTTGASRRPLDLHRRPAGAATPGGAVVERRRVARHRRRDGVAGAAVPVSARRGGRPPRRLCRRRAKRGPVRRSRRGLLGAAVGTATGRAAPYDEGGKSVRYTTLARGGVRPPAPAPSSRP